ncbi:MAG: hypothetical protein HRF43_20445 [Phycisphaerae bacterium]|jgi:hypothetical protein
MKLRINGIVRTAHRIRRALSAPLNEAQRRQLDAQVADALRRIDAVLARHRATAGHLPAPSRRAYQYLRRMQAAGASAPQPSAPGDAPEPCSAGQPESLSFRGLRSYLTDVLDDVARGVGTGRLNAPALLKLIQATASRLDQAMTTQNVAPARLKPESRLLLGWFRYFSRPEAFEEYIAAVRRAGQALLPLLNQRPRWHPPLLIHFRPSSLLYSIHPLKDGTRIILDTPMVTFGDQTLRLLAGRILGEARHQEAMMAAMMGPDYQRVRAALATAAGGGSVEPARGTAHDLAEVFERVNREYFDGQMPRPDLTWSRTLTGRKFGHYDFVHDRVCISSTLDSPDVPAFVIEHVMHHELLHKKHGYRFHGQRQHAHTPEFRAEERRFKRYAEADLFLNRLSRSMT